MAPPEKRDRSQVTVLTAIFFLVVALAEGLAINTAAADSHWPGLLDWMRQHPWYVIFATLTIGIGAVLRRELNVKYLNNRYRKRWIIRTPTIISVVTTIVVCLSPQLTSTPPQPACSPASETDESADSVQRNDAKVSVGGYPIAIALCPDDSRAYVTNSEDGTVSVIDTDTEKVSGDPIKVGKTRSQLLSAPVAAWPMSLTLETELSRSLTRLPIRRWGHRLK
jgi:YVTN family beta-propeller protein